MKACAAASSVLVGWQLWAVPVQAGKVCNHRASPNRHLSSIPRNGYGATNMQCAGRATAHREPLLDGKIRRPVNVCFREAAARHAMAGQSPERADLTNSSTTLRKVTGERGGLDDLPFPNARIQRQSADPCDNRSIELDKMGPGLSIFFTFRALIFILRSRILSVSIAARCRA